MIKSHASCKAKAAHKLLIKHNAVVQGESCATLRSRPPFSGAQRSAMYTGNAPTHP